MANQLMEMEMDRCQVREGVKVVRCVVIELAEQK